MEIWNLWVEFKKETQCRKFLSKIYRSPELNQFLSLADPKNKILQFTFNINPKEFALTFPKELCKSVIFGKEGDILKYKII